MKTLADCATLRVWGMGAFGGSIVSRRGRDRARVGSRWGPGAGGRFRVGRMRGARDATGGGAPERQQRAHQRRGREQGGCPAPEGTHLGRSRSKVRRAALPSARRAARSRTHQRLGYPEPRISSDGGDPDPGHHLSDDFRGYGPERSGIRHRAPARRAVDAAPDARDVEHGRPVGHRARTSRTSPRRPRARGVSVWPRVRPVPGATRRRWRRHPLPGTRRPDLARVPPLRPAHPLGDARPPRPIAPLEAPRCAPENAEDARATDDAEGVPTPSTKPDDDSDDSDDADDPATRVALALIRFYGARMISPLTPPSCRFVPTCSQYGMTAFRKFGPAKGFVLTAWRILRAIRGGRQRPTRVATGRSGRNGGARRLLTTRRHTGCAVREKRARWATAPRRSHTPAATPSRASARRLGPMCVPSRASRRAAPPRRGDGSSRARALDGRTVRLQPLHPLGTAARSKHASPARIALLVAISSTRSCRL